MLRIKGETIRTNTTESNQPRHVTLDSLPVPLEKDLFRFITVNRQKKTLTGHLLGYTQFFEHFVVEFIDDFPTNLDREASVWSPGAKRVGHD